MGVLVTGKTFKPAPAGLHQAVCCDVVDLGLIEVTYQGQTKRQHKIDVYWQTSEINSENNRPFLIRKRYTASLDQRATLRHDLESWRGKPFSEAELKGFDLDVLIGVNGQINVQHVERNGVIYANVTAIVPCAKGMAKLAVAADYVRRQDRQDAPADTLADDGATAPDDDDGIPF